MLTQKELNTIKKTLSSGGIIGIPTDTVYGLACDAYNPDAIKKINDIKGRDASKHYVIQIANKNQLKKLVKPLTKTQLEIIKNYWPGEITFIFHKAENINLHYLGSTIGIRIPNHKITQQILDYYNSPLVVTSLNKTGEAPATCYDEITSSLKNYLDYIVVSHDKGSQVASTIVDITNETPNVLRQGNIFFS